ncbi:hypothetical protein OH491_23635 [Termitidicoccus mucosus]
MSHPKKRPQLQYVPQAQKAVVEALLESGRSVRKVLEKIFALNQELLQRQEPP